MNQQARSKSHIFNFSKKTRAKPSAATDLTSAIFLHFSSQHRQATGSSCPAGDVRCVNDWKRRSKAFFDADRSCCGHLRRQLATTRQSTSRNPSAGDLRGDNDRRPAGDLRGDNDQDRVPGSSVDLRRFASQSKQRLSVRVKLIRSSLSVNQVFVSFNRGTQFC